CRANVALVEAVGLGERAAHLRERGESVRTEPALARLGIVTEPIQQSTGEGPELREGVDLLLADRRRPREPLVAGGICVAAALQEIGQASRELALGQGADVHAVQPSQLDLVEARRIAADALEGEASDELPGAEH